MLSVFDSRNLENAAQYEQINTDRRAIVEDCVEELAKRAISARSTIETGSSYETILADVPEHGVDSS